MATNDRTRFGIKKLLRQNRGFLIFILSMVMFRGAIADWNVVPTGSMKPTIVEGDRILVNKLAYDINVPFTTIRLFELDNPRRGDIVVFDSEKAGKRLVKRVVAVPGDIVVLRDNRLMINGEAAHYQPSGPISSTAGNQNRSTINISESILGYTHPIKLKRGYQSPLQNFGPVVVPENRYLMMGDNRDNSADSRVIGFVPRSEIIGKANHVLFSLDYNHYYLPRSERVWTPLL